MIGSDNQLLQKILDALKGLSSGVKTKVTGSFTACYKGTAQKIHVDTVYCSCTPDFIRYVGHLETLTGVETIDPLPPEDITECPNYIFHNNC